MAGLCMNCKYTSSCFLNSSTELITYCEEYELEKNNHTSIKNSEMELLHFNNNIEKEEISGLCVSCDFRSDCSLKGDYSIILNCESYQ